MNDLEAIYQKTPVAIQHALCSFEGWRICRSRYNARFRFLLQEVEDRNSWSTEALIDYRDQCLRAFVHHAAATVPFYRNRFKELGIVPADINRLEDLKILPILTKEEVQEHYPDLISHAVSPGDQIVAHTSGTTGGGLRFATTLEATQKQWATWWRYRRCHGLQLGTWCGYFGGRSVVPLSQTRPPFWRYNYPGKQILFSAYHVTLENMPAYVAELMRRQPPWLHGYPSLLALVAGYLLEKGADLGYQLKWLTVGAENLLPQQAEVLTKAFGVRPRQHYGMAEGVANMSECEYGSLHVDEDFAAVDFVQNEQGGGLKIIGTNFTNLATPLIRYDTQDVAELVEGEVCPCGRVGRVVRRIDGRHEDYVILKNGARLGRMDHIFKDLVNIREAQIYQRKPGEIIVRIVPGRRYTAADEQMLLREVKKRVGDGADVRMHYVNELARSKTGKLRFVVSEMPKGRLEGARL